MKLTFTKIESLKPRKKLYRVSDGQGLSLEVRTNGSKIWRFRFKKLDGKYSMISLGQYPEISLSETRDKAAEKRKLVAHDKPVTTKGTDFKSIFNEWHQKNLHTWTKKHGDLIILDEVSMIDITLLHHLLKAIPKGATVMMVGDVDQLPSVGAGNVLKDIINSNAVPVVRITEIFRQAQDSSIIVNAHLINQARIPNLTPRKDPDDFYFITEELPSQKFFCSMLFLLLFWQIKISFGPGQMSIQIY